jgi:hypothetical protein
MNVRRNDLKIAKKSETSPGFPRLFAAVVSIFRESGPGPVQYEGQSAYRRNRHRQDAAGELVYSRSTMLGKLRAESLETGAPGPSSHRTRPRGVFG